jgi:hypothetical protein
MVHVIALERDHPLLLWYSRFSLSFDVRLTRPNTMEVTNVLVHPLDISNSSTPKKKKGIANMIGTFLDFNTVAFCFYLTNIVQSWSN